MGFTGKPTWVHFFVARPGPFGHEHSSPVTAAADVTRQILRCATEPCARSGLNYNELITRRWAHRVGDTLAAACRGSGRRSGELIRRRAPLGGGVLAPGWLPVSRARVGTGGWFTHDCLRGLIVVRPYDRRHRGFSRVDRAAASRCPRFGFQCRHDASPRRRAGRRLLDEHTVPHRRRRRTRIGRPAANAAQLIAPCLRTITRTDPCRRPRLIGADRTESPEPDKEHIQR